MENDVPAAAPVAEQTAAPVQQAPENAPANDQEDDLGLGDIDTSEVDGAASPDEDEIEYEGKKYKVAKELKDAFLRNADYTRKTQEVAEQRRQIEAMRAQVEQSRAATDEELNKRGELAQIKATLAQYEQVDWRALQQSDFIAAQEHFTQYQLLKDKASALSGEIETAQNQRLATMQQETAKRIASSREEASKSLKGWSPEREDKAFSWAVNDLGISAPMLAQSMTPAVYKGIYLAWLGQQLLSRPAKAKAAETAEATPETSAPTPTRLSGKNGASPRGLHDNLSPDEWVKRRNEQLARRSG